jgi:RNA polymerase sigma factor (sigma-70 family)
MITPNQFVQDNYRDIKEWLRNITNKERPDLFDDFIHDVISIFLTNSKSQQAIDTGTARFFIVRIGLNQWRSSTSTFHYQYRHRMTEELGENINPETEEYNNTEDHLIELMLSSLDEMYETNRYEALIIILYYSLGANYSAVGRYLNMPHTTIRKIYLRGIKILENKIKNGINHNINSSGDIHSYSAKQLSLSIPTKLLTSKYFKSDK